MFRQSCLVCCLALVFVVGCTDYDSSYTPCNTDSDCTEAGTICINNECRDAPACQNDSDCDGDRICEAGVCTGPECSEDADCDGVARCEANRCVAVDCLESADCEEGFHCAEFVCEADECLINEDCAFDEICEDGVCEEREQTPCQTDEDCLADELCVQGFCLVPSPCEDDLGCPGNLVCDNGTCAHPCVDPATDCPPNHNCVSGHCYQQCFIDDNCQQTGTICEDGLCVPAQCATDEDCDGELVRCVEGRCEPYTICANDSDCTELHQVCMEGICEELPVCAIDQDCQEEPWCQDAPCVCTDGHCYHVPPCDTEEDCEPDQDCVGGLCVPHVCRGPEDCDTGYICVAGVCVLDDDPTAVVDVIILTPGGPIHQGDTVELEAVALDSAGNAVPGVQFEWDSSLPDRAAVDVAGVLTGGTEAGDTDVTATAAGTNVTSLATVFTNFTDATGQIRVVVVQATDRTPLEGVTVMMIGASSDTTLTDASGVATLPDPGGAVDIHVFSDDHDYLSILGTISKDILVPLNWRTDFSVAGGLKGQMAFPPGGSVSIGMAGTSIGGCLVDLNLAAFLGDLFTVTIEAMGYTFDMPLPSRMVARANVFVELNIKDTYYSFGHDGLRAAWAMGGNLDLEISEIIDLVGEISSIEQIIGTLLPYFAVFDHATKPAFQVDPIPLVVDADDIDGDTDTTEMRPDWTSFPTVDMEPDHSQDLAVQVSPPELPSHGGVPIATAVFIAGSMSSQGFTPLGLTAQEATAGVVDPLTMKLAPPYGGLEAGRYSMLVMGFPTEEPSQNQDLPTDVAMVVYSGWNLPTDLSFDSEFLPFPEDAVYTAADRSLTGTQVTGATLLRSTVQGSMGIWEIYMSNADVLAYTLPDPPAGMDDLAGGETATLDPMALEAGTTFEDLITFNGDDLDQINRLATAFTRYEL